MRLLWAALLSCTTSVVFAQAAPTVTRYYVYDVGTIVGNLTMFRVNQNGAMIWNSNGRALLYQNCLSRDLGHLGGGSSVARAISNNGVVVGKSRKADGRWRAFSYSNGTMRDLGGGGPDHPLLFEEATAVNFWGDIAGIESAAGTLALTAVRYSDQVATPMARFQTPQGLVTVTNVDDMNDSGDVAGSIRNGANSIALRSSNMGHLWTQVAGVPGLDFATFPFAMNRYGHIVGIAGNGLTRAFLSRDPATPATDLGTLGGTLSQAFGINNYDWVVGWAEQTSSGGPRAFVHDGTQMIDLNSVLWNGSGWLLREALDVNDAGQIVGEGLLNGQLHAFFLQPMRRPPLYDPCGRIVIGGVLERAN